jgi:hypothetical protein
MSSAEGERRDKAGETLDRPFLLQSAQDLLSGCLTSSRKIRALRSVVALSCRDMVEAGREAVEGEAMRRVVGSRKRSRVVRDASPLPRAVCIFLAPSGVRSIDF